MGSPGDSASYVPLASGTANNWSWTKLVGEFTVPSCGLAELDVYLEGPAPGVVMFADDVAVTEICP